eukprot:4185289-Alexandrium_andersonii.AAC.1
MQVPVRVSEGEAQGARKFMKGAIYQLCLRASVECLTTPQQVSPEAVAQAAGLVTRLTVSLHEAYAPDEFSEIFEE